MNLQLTTHHKKLVADITISGSKSESNRLLILQQLFPSIKIENLSDSDDSKHLEYALSTEEPVINIGHAGTAMRFLTAFFAMQKNKEVILTGSERMQNRPIEILVNALQDLGAAISYEAKVGYPPIKIKGKELQKSIVQIQGNVSSQYISALLLVAASLKDGLQIELLGEITSIPYINMSLSLLKEVGVEAQFIGNKIQVYPKKEVAKKTIIVESDWSSASYFYSLIALSEMGSEITLTAYKKESLQGDSCLERIYKHFGVTTVFTNKGVRLKKEEAPKVSELNENLKNAPDIAQTIAVTCFGLGISCNLSGLHTLKIKETDRLEALKEELTKLGADIQVTNETLHLKKNREMKENISIATYNDHRMAMAFAPLALKKKITILNAEVVTKSYRAFWNDMKKIGIEIKELK
ncbi:3-phosphoshikimate 1-carboxyvinyltransferase [Tenacibaculum maritimum]|uniref:3-phosphoshikimate 1-carboxyvinyltransferase n=1 Tax=Tenacibaculum maritimum TaxID=107401 RepID=UPI001E42FD62|nr:3-phosphoshikimate 1-carboxyvinyltransferase [Tenacibaculum maritimum]MCD9583910.1 3-phosphoshikimate 1-carboxyvinyltransferase [Tenacibaculum maritimum]MCD9620532.1 3-phosphoshikimate 1-carboxyvinyltransferase [Tenacibaculum maritimum]MCD9626621.1 3-phosphoshikimate 1-carboxyvinyltransferase [Tenacibaculum maritimum]MCD9629335.1 3-phosphoshikimate 1-carboxyvinyltransferase [Tenacibaculum maritimum]MCD9631970.1 3-phosphoshikimate 1-carboxyvinyltransferase [Tenacibaculum maritimum]